jgi:RNA polymerase sigma-70 factor (ECF subfamily)
MHIEPGAQAAAAIAGAGQIAEHLLTSLRGFTAPPAGFTGPNGRPAGEKGPRANMDANHPAGPAPAPSMLSAQAADAVAAEQARRHERDLRLIELLAQAAAGSASAFESFYDATIPHAQALARRMLPMSDVEDILADAFFQAWRELPRFDPARGSPVTWLLTILRSRALDLLRHRRCSPETERSDDVAEPAADAPGPETLLAQTESNDRLHSALAELSPNERWVLGLAYYREMPHAAIASATGLPLGTVKSLILRAQHKLREQLAP